MLGMLLKDIIYIKKLKKTLLYIILLLFFLSISGLFETNYLSSLSYFVMFFCVNLSTLPFSYDSYSHFSEYQYALPVSRKTAVYSRYLLGLVLFGICILFQSFTILLDLFLQKEISNPEEFIMIQFSAVLFVPLLQSILFPLLYKFGAEKGRLYMVGIIIFVCCIVGFFVTESKPINISIHLLPFLIGILLFVTLFYILSMLLCIKIEQKNQK